MCSSFICICNDTAARVVVSFNKAIASIRMICSGFCFIFGDYVANLKFSYSGGYSLRCESSINSSKLWPIIPFGSRNARTDYALYDSVKNVTICLRFSYECLHLSFCQNWWSEWNRCTIGFVHDCIKKCAQVEYFLRLHEVVAAN